MERNNRKAVFKVVALIIMLSFTISLINNASESLTQVSRENILSHIAGGDVVDCFKQNNEVNELARKNQMENDPFLKGEERIITRINIISYIIQILTLFIFAYLIVHILNNDKSNNAVESDAKKDSRHSL